MKFFEYFVGNLLSSVDGLIALSILIIIIVLTATQLSEITDEAGFFAKLFRLGCAAAIAVTGSYLGGLYIDSTGGFPSGASSKILFFVITLLSIILWQTFLRGKIRHEL